jgi:hypothetical protein
MVIQLHGPALYAYAARFYLPAKNYPAAYTAALKGIGSDGSSRGVTIWSSIHGSAVDNANLNYQFFLRLLARNDLVTCCDFCKFD